MSKFKKGDKVVCVEPTISDQLVRGQTYTVTRVRDDLVYVNGSNFSWIERRFKLADCMSHLYDNEKPFGLLSKEEQQYIRNNMRSLEWYAQSGIWRNKVGQSIQKNSVYRVKRPPERVSITSLTGTVEMKDGKPDWTTYKE